MKVNLFFILLIVPGFIWSQRPAVRTSGIFRDITVLNQSYPSFTIRGTYTSSIGYSRDSVQVNDLYVVENMIRRNSDNANHAIRFRVRKVTKINPEVIELVLQALDNAVVPIFPVTAAGIVKVTVNGVLSIDRDLPFNLYNAIVNHNFRSIDSVLSSHRVKIDSIRQNLHYISKLDTIDFPEIASNTSVDSLISVVGALPMNHVLISFPNGVVSSAANFFPFVSDTNQVTLRLRNTGAVALNLSATPFRFTIIK